MAWLNIQNTGFYLVQNIGFTKSNPKHPGNDSGNDWHDDPDKEKKLYLFKDRKKMRMKKSCKMKKGVVNPFIHKSEKKIQYRIMRLA